MKKIKKLNLKINQTVFSFACVCGSDVCRIGTCSCNRLGVSQTSWYVSQHHMTNRNSGGSLVGGAG